jgi:hypothetical protein
MRYVTKTALLLLFVASLAIGCSAKKTGPDNKPSPSTGMKHLWSKRFGDANSQQALAVAGDASGNVIVAGTFAGAVDFGGGALTSAGHDDIFVAKFRSNGDHLWSKRFGDGFDQRCNSVAVDALGNVILAGYCPGAVDFGGGALTSAGQDDIFVAKFASDGAHLWSKRFGDGTNQYAALVAVDASGNVILAGYFPGTVDFGGGALACAGNGDIFVAKFASDGAHLWSKRFGDGFDQRCYSVAVDASGNVIVTGTFAGTVDFGGGALTCAGNGDIFVAKFASDGAHLWSRRFGDGNAAAAAVDASGNVIVAGYFKGAVDFGGGALTSAGGYDIFVAKFASDGAHLWSKRFGDGSYQGADAVAVDASGNVIVTGRGGDTIDFGGGALAGNYIFVAKFGPNGAHLWSKGLGDWTYAYAVVTVDASGNVIVTGAFAGTVDFGGGALTSTSAANEIFVAKFGW